MNASGRLTINGLEFNWVQPLDFLLEGSAWTGFGFTANYTIIDQKGEGAAPAIAIGVPPESYNATFYYENHGVSARVSVTHNEGSQITGPNSNQQGVAGRRAVRRRLYPVGLLVQLRFLRRCSAVFWVPQLTVDVINLTEGERRTYYQFSNATFNAVRFWQNGDGGSARPVLIRCGSGGGGFRPILLRNQAIEAQSCERVGKGWPIADCRFIM